MNVREERNEIKMEFAVAAYVRDAVDINKLYRAKLAKDGWEPLDEPAAFWTLREGQDIYDVVMYGAVVRLLVEEEEPVE